MRGERERNRKGREGSAEEGRPLKRGAAERHGEDSCKQEGNEAKTGTEAWVTVVLGTSAPIPENAPGPGQEHRSSFSATFPGHP